MHADFDAAFTRRLGAGGWIGMTWPRRYGGRECSYLERFVVNEEMLAAGAPRAAHSVGDRQIGPGLLRYGTDQQRQRFLPDIARGEYHFAIGMSEPQAGSDLAAVETRADKVPGGWRVNGRKSWLSWAHKAHAFMALVRSSPLDEERGGKRHEGLSQMIIELDAPGVKVEPVLFMNGRHHFNDVILENVFVPDALLVGEAGQGWKQVTSELTLERSGPERYMTVFPLLLELLRRLQGHGGKGGHGEETIGAISARLWAIRRMAIAIAIALDPVHGTPDTLNLDLEATLVRDMSTFVEHEMVEAARTLIAVQPTVTSDDIFLRYIAETVACAPIASIGGGTTEVLRSLIARRLLGPLQ
jgi:alkylation response protein AidB-like acyl-CoA dehydrogenase